MHIDFLYFDDCPSHAAALERLHAVLAEEQLQPTLTVIKVETEEQAAHLRFTGSPTILINGQDITPPPSDAIYALTCRAYRLENGRISPLPSPELIRAALRRAQET